MARYLNRTEPRLYSAGRLAGKLLCILTAWCVLAFAAYANVSVTPATIAPDPNGVARFSIDVSAVPGPGLRSYALEVTFSGPVVLVDNLVTTTADPTKVSCDATLAAAGPGETALGGGLMLVSGQGALLLNALSSNPGAQVLTAANLIVNPTTARYNFGVSGTALTPSTGSGPIIEYRCFVGAGVPAASSVVITPRLFPNQTGVVFLANAGTPIINTFNTGQIQTGAMANTPPVANAGVDQSAALGATVQLDGSGSGDADGDPLSYRWSLTGPAGSTAMLSDPGIINPVFTVDLPGSYSAQLIVNDGAVDSAPDTAIISTVNTIPAANAGVDQSVQVGATVQLDGSGSRDADNDPLSYRWTLSAPAGSRAMLSDPALVNPAFGADLAGTYAAQLIVNDGSADSMPDTAQITVAAANPLFGVELRAVWVQEDGKIEIEGEDFPPGLAVTIRDDQGQLIATPSAGPNGKWKIKQSLLRGPCQIQASVQGRSITVDVVDAPPVCQANPGP